MLTACFITGTVMMKMMSSTSMTSTRGVMLISFITSSASSCVPKAMVSASLSSWATMPWRLASAAVATRAPVTK
ncbi:MAG: hypothetical protein QM777_11545 [Pseudorhodoferax sp.]